MIYILIKVKPAELKWRESVTYGHPLAGGHVCDLIY